MRQILIGFLILLSVTGIVNEASARGFGGGRGFSMARARPAFSHSYQRPASSAVRPNKWRGAFTGFMMGSILTSLFMGHGMMGGMFSWLLLGMGVFFVLNILKRLKERDRQN